MKISATIQSENTSRKIRKSGNKFLLVEFENGVRISQIYNEINATITTYQEDKNLLLPSGFERRKELSKTFLNKEKECEHLRRIRTVEKNGYWGYKCAACHKYQ